MGILGIVILAAVAMAAFQEGEDLFQKALRLERNEGKIKEAIVLYQQILTEFKNDRTLAAKAQLHIGYCFEKIGQKEAQKAYQSVIDQYADQTEQVAAARARLSEMASKLKPEPIESRLYSWSDDNFYLEDHALSPDGSKLLGVHISREKGQNIVYKDLVAGEYKFVTNYDGDNEENGWAYDPVMSPDNNQIAFSFGGWKNEKNEELRITNLSGDTRTLYSCQNKGEEIFPVEWFPDGQSLLAVHLTVEKVIQLGIIPLANETFKVIYEVLPDENIRRKIDLDRVIQADLSNDGKRIIFRELRNGTRDLYVLDVESKKVSPFLESPNNKAQPCWSPDGKYVAFLSDRSGVNSIWVVPVGSSGIAEGQPYLYKLGPYNRLKSWTDQGMCYSSWVDMVDIFIMPVDPNSGAPIGKPVQLNFQPTGRNSLAVWSPDGKQLAFMSNLSGGRNDLHLVVFSIEEEKYRTFKCPSPRMGGTHPPSMADLQWLPDGSGVSYSAYEAEDATSSMTANSRKLYILNVKTEEWQSHPLKLENYSSSTAWRDDGQAFYYSRNSWEPVALQTGIVEHDLKTGEERYIYTSEIQERQGFTGMRCSRDYSKIATHFFREKKIGVINIKSGELVHEFKFFGFPSPPGWSPDGKLLMMSMWRQNQKLHVFSLSDSSQKAYDVDMWFAPNSGIAYLDWSPDGTKVAFTGNYTKFETYLQRNVELFRDLSK